MTLPFDIPDKNKRKYQCFVCGMMYMDFAGFEEHIIDTHEEGREYIKCPIKHCEAPIRDVRMHFKVKHPKTPIPKKGMMKALIWKDFSPRKGKRNKKPKFREGYYESTKMKRSFHYRSGYEAKVYEYLDSDIDVLSFDVEPFKVPYLHKGKQRKYIPDLLVTFYDGRVEVWEIKPANQTLLEVNQNKWAAANNACIARGWKFVVQTEKGIEQLRQKVKKQLQK